MDGVAPPLEMQGADRPSTAEAYGPTEAHMNTVELPIFISKAVAHSLYMRRPEPVRLKCRPHLATRFGRSSLLTSMCI